MVADFVEWTTIAGDPDYTSNSLYQRDDAFTFNYTNTVSPSGVPLNGTWRSVYKQAYDTDSPHTTPWEMLALLLNRRGGKRSTVLLRTQETTLYCGKISLLA